MATIKISRAKSCSAAIDYARGRNQLKAADRDWLVQHGVPFETVDTLNNRAVAVSGQLVDPDYAKNQMKQTRELFQNAGKTEAMRVIQSFSHEDLDPTNPADWQRCNDLGNELAQRIAPNHQVAIYTHIDGTGHMLHNHIIINMPNLETGKKYNHNNDWQRVCDIANQISREHGLTVIDREQAPAERRTMAERQLNAKNEYVWKDDLRGRIDNTMSDSSISSYKDFSEHLAKSGIIIHDRGKSFSYEFLDANKKHRRARGKTLGADYEKETILNELELRQEPSDPDIGHLRKYSREAETSYLSSQQRSDGHGRDYQIATSNDHETERDNQRATNTGQRVDSLRISINGIAEAIRQYYSRLVERIKLARLKEQQRAKQLKTARRHHRGLGR
ncbi:relaxase/mobilization nuclease domain-containing protein [Lactiplantibacillus plantarum]|uniref:relaxase/mobilization nuclease domain-containing protein n=1 Tax=Lactiplantibacillus plantarum TaxID=1590 RepID=UPI00034E5F79|nr:relaxase/mobilization nuclease domain-containing protein [Lactiplantibacillus plantarum]EPD25119.1 mobilization protein A [Lactiplantibacillus plantarum IPLA88]